MTPEPPVVLRLRRERDARRARLERPHLGIGVGDALRKQRQHASRRQLGPTAREAGVVARGIIPARPRFVRAIDGDAAEGVHRQPPERIAEERALGEKPRRPSRRHPQDDRIEETVRVVEHEHQRLAGRDPLGAVDDPRRIVEAHQRLPQPTNQRREHAGMIRQPLPPGKSSGPATAPANAPRA